MKRYSRRGRTNMNKKTLNLPMDLIIQILLRLPVKSLVRFKCVCKSWLSLITDPHFAKSHFQLAAALTHRLLLAPASVPETRSIDLDDASLNDDSASTTIELKFMLPSYYFHLSSCRGFLFLDCNPNLFLWNPSTGVHNQIPHPPISSNVDAFLFTYLYGFGYDPSQDDYLVVLASYDPNSADYLTHLEFFSWRANTWKEIEGTHLPYMNAGDDPRVGSLLHDAIHWVAFRHDINVDLIVAFDLVEKRLSDIPLPDEFYHESADYDVWVFRGFLSLWVVEADTVSIWVMERYKLQSSWVMTLALSLNDIPNKYFSPICCTKNGDIVGTDGYKELVKYNGEGEVLEHCSYDEYPYTYVSLAMYTESLLSLPAGEQVEDV